MHLDYQACALELGSCEAQEPMLRSKRITAMRSLRTTRELPCVPKLEKSQHSNEDPAQPKINKLIKLLKKKRLQAQIHFQAQIPSGLLLFSR